MIDFITISTLGNAADFGDLTDEYYGTSGTSNSIRGVFSAGGDTPGDVNTIFYITIATLGNALDFGDLTIHLHSMHQEMLHHQQEHVLVEEMMEVTLLQLIMFKL